MGFFVNEVFVDFGQIEQGAFSAIFFLSVCQLVIKSRIEFRGPILSALPN